MLHKTRKETPVIGESKSSDFLYCAATLSYCANIRLDVSELFPCHIVGEAGVLTVEHNHSFVYSIL